MSASQFLDDSSFSVPSFATSFPSTEAIAPVQKQEPAMPSFADVASFADVSTPFADVAPSQTDSGFASLFGEEDVKELNADSALQPVPVMNPVPRSVSTHLSCSPTWYYCLPIFQLIASRIPRSS
ncbi:hypothetical protein [Dictyobacter kobayashii]|uniref:hypothetical protein n=1 Tax=Dictyobacter kobayashii TaxID=2014872 RepID=UPI0013875456|nr:hypothetical protein [Dictyobacter kobayashii]